MFAQIEYPENLLPEELDIYLADGWFRMRQTIFTTHFLHFNQRFYSAIWLRVGLDQTIYDKKYFVLKKLNKGFRTEIKKTGIEAITAQHELLYQYYRQSISFDVSPSLRELLLGNETFNRFNTYEVNIFDGEIMIAAGFFDLGKLSAAGITSIYNPVYKKYSLGKYLMYLKMDFCIQQQLQYFYPGYVVPGYHSFNYKLEIGKATLQYLQLSTRNWLPYIPSIPILNPLQDMLEKLTTLQEYLSKNKIPNDILFYRFFEANLDPFYFGRELFDFPVFLFCLPSIDPSVFSIIVFDVMDSKYQHLQCNSVLNIGFYEDCHTIFDADLLKVDQHLFSSSFPEKMGVHLAGIVKKNN